MKLQIKYKIMALAIGIVVQTVLILSILIIIQKNRIDNTVGKELDVLARDNLAQISRDVYGICETTNDLVQQKGNNDLRVAHDVLNIN